MSDGKIFDFKAFADTSVRQAIHCKDIGEATILCRALHKNGFHYANGNSYIDDIPGGFAIFKEDTCYTNDGYVAFADNFSIKRGCLFEFDDYSFSHIDRLLQEFTEER